MNVVSNEFDEIGVSLPATLVDIDLELRGELLGDREADELGIKLLLDKADREWMERDADGLCMGDEVASPVRDNTALVLSDTPTLAVMLSVKEAVMDIPLILGVIAGDSEVMSELEAAADRETLGKGETDLSALGESRADTDAAFERVTDGDCEK